MMRAALLIAATAFTALFTAPAHAQQAFASSRVYTPRVVGRPVSEPVVAGSVPMSELASEEPTIELIGRITNPAGPLPGAVVILTATKQMAATNADGQFRFVVPATAGALAAVVTYAGYADEPMTLNAAAEASRVSLTHARVIVVSRKMRLKKYLKTARKQVKRELRSLR